MNKTALRLAVTSISMGIIVGNTLVAQQATGRPWVGTWSSAQMLDDVADIRLDGSSAATVRETVHVSAGGKPSAAAPVECIWPLPFDH